MKSENRSDPRSGAPTGGPTGAPSDTLAPLHLEKGLATTAEDVRALRRAASSAAPLDAEAFLRFLENFEDSTDAAPREIPPRHEPFELR
jgi:hypothetical protein